MTNISHNFYFGLVCSCEFHQMFDRALEHLNLSTTNPNRCPSKKQHIFNYTLNKNQLQNRLTVATLFINGNYNYAKTEMIRILNKISLKDHRSIHVLTGLGYNTMKLPFPVKSVYYVSRRNAFNNDYPRLRYNIIQDICCSLMNIFSYTRDKTYTDRYNSGDVVIILAGPLGRILASEWCLARHDVTFLEMGSFWDKEIWNRSLRLDKRIPCMHTSYDKH